MDKNVKNFYNVNSLAVYLEEDYLLLPLPILNLRNGVCVPLLLVPPFLYLVTRTFYTFLAMQRFSNCSESDSHYQGSSYTVQQYYLHRWLTIGLPCSCVDASEQIGR